MWMVDPKLLCKNHLLGEHGEIHKHKHNFVKGHSIKGRLNPFVAIEPLNMQSRHDALAEEMINRNYNHKSPYEQPELIKYSINEINSKVDIELSIRELKKRCSECNKRIEQYM